MQLVFSSNNFSFQNYALTFLRLGENVGYPTQWVCLCLPSCAGMQLEKNADK